MNKKIRSISIAKTIDNKLITDSEFRGLTISANITRILHEYFQNQSFLSPKFNFSYKYSMLLRCCQVII